MLELTKLAARYLEQYGKEKVSEITGVSVATVPSLIKQGKFPLLGVEKLLAFDPAPIHALKPLYPEQTLGEKLIILMPCNGNPEPECMDTLMKLYDRKEMDYKRVGFNNLSVARNALAAHFLRGPWQWAYWSDADTVHPCGDATAYRAAASLTAQQISDTFASVNAIYRLMVHKRSFVSGVYIARKKGGTGQFGGSDKPEIQAIVRRGPQDRVLDVPWTGFGGVLTHRKVFEDIIAQQGDEIRHKSPYLKQRFGYDYSLFDPTTKETPGDDIPLAARAIRAGHQPAIDLAVQFGHVGKHTYTFADAA